MFDFGNTNDAQKEAITTVKGPLLIIAGPGTGKTYTLVKRTIYMITEEKIAPESIMIVTFTEKAAKELITRITNELDKLNLYVNINDMFIGTFHSICLRLLKENIDYTSLRKSFKIIDDFEQQYLVYQNLNKFLKIKNIENIINIQSGYWRISQYIADFVNNLNEELINPDLLVQDENPDIVVLRRNLRIIF